MNNKEEKKTFFPLRKNEAAVDDKIENDIVSLVQAYFREEFKVVENETPKEKKYRLTQVYSKLISQFLMEHQNDKDNKIKLKKLIKERITIERILTDHSIFLPKTPTGQLDYDKIEKTFKLVEGVLMHAWEAMHSGLYAKSIESLGRRIMYLHYFWNSQAGKIKLKYDMGLDAEAIQKHRELSPVIFGPAEQLNPLPAMLTMGYRDLRVAIKEANDIIRKLIGQYIELTSHLEKKMVLSLPTLKFDQVSKASTASSNLHIHGKEGEIFGLFSDKTLARENRMPIDGLMLKIKPTVSMNKKTGEPVVNKDESCLVNVVEKVEKYVEEIERNGYKIDEFTGIFTVDNTELDDLKKYLSILKGLEAEFINQEEVKYVEFATKMNQRYIKTFFPNIPMPIEFVDDQADGRLGNFFKYVEDMNTLVNFMVEREFFDGPEDLLCRISIRREDGSYTKFARYYWDMSKQKFVVNPSDNMDFGSDVGKEYPELTLDDVRDTKKFVSIPLKAIEYVMFGFGIMPEIVVCDDGVYYEAYNGLAQTCRDVTGGNPTYWAYLSVDPTKTGY